MFRRLPYLAANGIPAARVAPTPYMSEPNDLTAALTELLQEVLTQYEERVPESGRFADLRAGRAVHFGDPDTTRPGRVEIAVMHMDTEIDRNYEQVRFLAVRVWKSRDGGTASTTCFHGTKTELKASLQAQLDSPYLLVERAEELAHGLPEESNPDIWR